MTNLFNNNKIEVMKRQRVKPPYWNASPDNSVPINLPKALDI